MVPYLEIPSFKLLGITLHPFGLLLAAALYLGYFLVRWRARVVGLDVALTTRGMLWMLAGAFIGGHLVEVLLYNPERVLENPLVLLMFWSGLSSFGGFIGAGVAAVLFFRRHGESALAHCDAMIYGVVPGWILGRLGCTIVHDHPGQLSSFFLAVQYPGGARHDLGFYELLLTIGLAAVLLLVRRARPFHGFHVLLILSIYAPVRFMLDFLRAADATYLGLTPAQYFSALGFAASATLLLAAWRRRQRARAVMSELVDDAHAAKEVQITAEPLASSPSPSSA